MSNLQQSPIDYISTLRVVDLRKELRALGMDTKGRKTVLVQRFRMAVAAMTPSPAPVQQRVYDAMSPTSFPDMSPSASMSSSECSSEEEEENQSPSSLFGVLGRSSTPPQKQQQTQQSWSPTPMSIQRASPKRALFADKDADDFASPSPKRQTPEQSPRSAMRRSSEGGTSKRARLSFGHVEVRRYSLMHGGSLSTPSKGAFPLGLDWNYDEGVVKPLQEYEEEKALTPTRIRRLNEKQRKRLLEKTDKRPYFERQASWDTEKEDLKQIRRGRCNVGCHCTEPGACGTIKCLCVREGLACNDDSCRCTEENCTHHLRYNFDQDKVNAYRRKKIMAAPYTLREGTSAW